MQENPSNQDWLAVIGRALAQISMHLAQVSDKTISERAAFLSNLGLERNEIAVMVGSSTASISELLRQRSKKEEANAKSKKSGK